MSPKRARCCCAATTWQAGPGSAGALSKAPGVLHGQGGAVPKQVSGEAVPHAGGLPREVGGTGGSDALEDAYALLKQNAVVGVFIEGHRSKDGLLRKPKTGAALLAYETKAPVVPVCITAGTASSPACSSAPHPLWQAHLRRGAEHQDDSSLQLRRASRIIMAQIAQLREEACKSWACPLSWCRQRKRRPPCGLRWPRPPGSALAWTGR